MVRVKAGRRRTGRLRADDRAAWPRARAMFRAIDGVPIGDLDRMTATAGDDGDGKQGRPVEWNDPELSPDPVDGALMLSDIAAFVRRHVWIDERSADALALWAVMTWIHERLEISTFANLTSATKRCGKSLLVEVLHELVYRPVPFSGQVTAAVLPFDVHPRNHRGTAGQSKAYFRDALRPVFDAYLPGTGEFDPSRRPNALKQGISVNSYPSQPETAGRNGNHGNPYKNRDWDGGTDETPVLSGNGTGSVQLPLQPPGTERTGDAYRRARDGE